MVMKSLDDWHKYLDNNKSGEWGIPYTKWFDENFPSADYEIYNSGYGSIVFMTNDPDIVLAFKLRWS